MGQSPGHMAPGFVQLVSVFIQMAVCPIHRKTPAEPAGYCAQCSVKSGLPLPASSAGTLFVVTLNPEIPEEPYWLPFPLIHF